MKFLIPIVVVCVGAAAATSLLDYAIHRWVSDDACPEVTDVKVDFNPKSFLGKWYNLERYTHPFELASICTTVTYSQLDDGTFQAVTDGVNQYTGEKVSTTFPVVLADPKADHLEAKVNITVFNIKRTDYILDTDYTNWAVIYDCKIHEGNQSTHLYWLLSRTPELTVDEKSLERIAALKAKYIDLTEIRIVPMHDEKCSHSSGTQ